jgi:peptidoglycan/LPS O-acetylase OafA/YrhL
MDDNIDAARLPLSIHGYCGVSTLGTIRFLLALAVVCAHVGKLPYTVQLGGQLAVQSFYIISGFLIALVWTNKYERRANGLFLFYSNRAARIYILYWVVLVISIVVALVTKSLTHDFPSYFGSRPRGLLPYTIFTNTWIFGSSWAYWLGFDWPDGPLYFTMDFTSSPYPVWGTLILGPAWTLDLELSFYLLAPFLVGLRLRYILAIIAASLVARFSWYAMGHDLDPWNYRFFPFEIGLFMLGVAAYRVSSKVAWQPNPMFLKIAFAALVGSMVRYGSLGLPYGSFIYLFIFAALIPYVFNLTRSWRFDRFLADMSFPLYLAHWPVASISIFVRDRFLAQPAEYRGIVPAIASITAAALLVIFVERPVERWRQSRIGPAKAGAPVAGEVSPAAEELSVRQLSGG